MTPTSINNTLINIVKNTNKAKNKNTTAVPHNQGGKRVLTSGRIQSVTKLAWVS